MEARQHLTSIVLMYCHPLVLDFLQIYVSHIDIADGCSSCRRAMSWISSDKDSGILNHHQPFAMGMVF
jgi:hypothetical protein